MHAIERLYPFIVQEAGYTSGWVLEKEMAEKELEAYYGMLRRLNEALISQYGCQDEYSMYDIVKGQGLFSLIFNKSLKISTKIKLVIKRLLGANTIQKLKKYKRRKLCQY